MASRAEKWARVCRWLTEAHDDVRVSDLAEAFDVNPSTASRWMKRWKDEGPPAALPAQVRQQVGPPTKRPRNRGAERTPAAQLSEDDRAVAVQTVRDLNHVVSEMAARMRAALDTCGPGEIPDIDPRAAQALLSLRKTATEAQDSHPGLMALAEGEGSKKPTKRDLGEVFAAMGLPPPNEDAEA